MRSPRSRKRGLSEVIGTLFFVLIIFVAMSFFLVMFDSFSNYASTLKHVNQQQIQQGETKFSIPSFSFGSSGGVGTVATTVAQTSTSYSQERKLLYSQGLWWVFYSYGARGGGQGLMYQSSPDGATWSSPVSISTMANTQYGFDFSVYQNGTYVDIVIASGSQFDWRYGIMYPNGIISFPYGFASHSTTNSVVPSDGFCSIVTDVSGNTWVALNTQSGGPTEYIEVWEHLGPGNTNRGTWTRVDYLSGLPTDVAPILVPTSSGVAMMYGSGATTGTLSITNTTISNPTTWSLAVSPPSYYAMLDSSAVAVGNNIYFAGLASSTSGSSSGTVDYFSYTAGQSSTSPESVLQAASSSWQVSISVCSKTLDVFFGTGSNLYFIFSDNLGQSFGAAQTISTSENSITGVTSAYSAPGVVWMSGSSSPFNLRFFASSVVSITNASPFPIRLISLYIYDTTANVLYHFDTNSSAPGVSGSFDYWMAPGQTLTVPESFNWIPSDSFSITVTTDQGLIAAFYLTAPA